MLLAKILIHKNAMPIARHAVRTFAALAPGDTFLELHSDGSLDEDDWKILVSAAAGIEIRLVYPAHRKTALAKRLEALPRTGALLQRQGYLTKLEMLAVGTEPFLYFDSDVVWLRPFDPASLPSTTTVFSTET